MLAIDGHGTAVPASGEVPVPGRTYGSLSNLVVSLTAVVWDQTQGSYVQRTFDRAHPHCTAFLTHLGRAFLTEVNCAWVRTPICGASAGSTFRPLSCSPPPIPARNARSPVAGMIVSGHPKLAPAFGQLQHDITGLDVAANVGVPGAQPPALSAVRPQPDRPAWDVAVWFDVLTLPGTPHANDFYRELEEFAFRNYRGSYAALRPSLTGRSAPG